MERSSIAQHVGAGVRSARLDRGWTQERLAAEAGLSQVAVSELERGVHAALSLDRVQAVCRALGTELAVEVRPLRVVGRVDQRDPAHAACVAAVRRLLERAGWRTATEVEITTGRAQGFIDLLAFDPATRRVLVIEVKTELRDVGALERQVGWYVREAHGAALRLGWRPGAVSGLVACLATTAIDGAVLANRQALAMAFPVRGRPLKAALLHGADLAERGLFLVDPLRHGAAVVMGLAADGRRSATPYRDYADFMRARSGLQQRGAGRGPTRAPRVFGRGGGVGGAIEGGTLVQRPRR